MLLIVAFLVLLPLLLVLAHAPAGDVCSVAAIAPAFRLTEDAANLLGMSLKLGPRATITRRDIQRMLRKHRGAKNRYGIIRKKYQALRMKTWRAQKTSTLARKSHHETPPVEPNIVNNVIPFPICVTRREPAAKLGTETCTEDNIRRLITDSGGISSHPCESGKLLRAALDSKASFRAFAQIVRSLAAERLYAGQYRPASNTIIHWAIRAGIAKLLATKPLKEPSIDIMDHWIGTGNLKVLVVMRLALSTYQKRKPLALRLRDFTVIHCSIMTESNGEKMRALLEGLYSRVGYPLGVLCDNGSDLCKGIKLLNQNESNTHVAHIQDVSHKVACIIKKEYKNLGWFKKFTKNVQDGQSKLTNSKYAHLRSPRQNTKARFMNISKVVDWATWALQHMQSGSPDSDELKKFREAYGSLHEHSRRMLPHMKKTLDIANETMRILKIKGMNETTHQEVLQLISNLGPENKVRAALKDWLESQISVLRQLRERGWTADLPISSDAIESLFSQYKQLQGRAPQGDPTRLVAIIPLLVGTDSAEDLYQWIHSCGQREAEQWVRREVPETIHAKKRKLNAKPKVKVTKTRRTDSGGRRPYEQRIAA